LKKNKLLIENNKPQIQLPPLSVTALVLKRADNIKTQFGYLVSEAEAEKRCFFRVTVANTATGIRGLVMLPVLTIPPTKSRLRSIYRKNPL
jgi:hypothetical protein